MEEEEKKIMYQNIYQQFFMQSDNFLVQKWSRNKISGKSFSEQDRQEAYHHFYQKVKKDKVANRQTIRRWFGLGGSSIPSREFSLVLAKVNALPPSTAPPRITQSFPIFT